MTTKPKTRKAPAPPCEGKPERDDEFYQLVLELVEDDLEFQEDAAARGCPGAAEKAETLRGLVTKMRPAAAPAPGNYSKVSRTLAEFDQAPDKWGNA